MGYVLSKIAWILLQPSSVLILAAGAGLWLAFGERWRRLGLRLGVAAVVALLVIGLLPVGTLTLLPLENRFPAPAIAAGSNAYAGIIVLGGGEDGRITHVRGQLHLNEAAERITEGARLALKLPNARIAFTGGAAFSVLGEVSAGQAIRKFWEDVGIASGRIVLEDRSRTTYENARLLRDILKPKAGERWLLVTSAAHMPRSMGVFRQAGYDVVAYPVDYRTQGGLDAGDVSINLANGLKRLDDAVKEWVGLVGYRVLHRTNALFPRP